jgi:hypothetical protein
LIVARPQEHDFLPAEAILLRIGEREDVQQRAAAARAGATAR